MHSLQPATPDRVAPDSGADSVRQEVDPAVLARIWNSSKSSIRTAMDGSIAKNERKRVRWRKRVRSSDAAALPVVALLAVVREAVRVAVREAVVREAK